MATVRTVRVPSTGPTVKTAKATEPTPKAETKVKAVKKASINVGATTGMRVMAFQDQLLNDNFKAHLTDEQLLAAMRKEFPNAKGKIFTAPLETQLAILRSVRTVFNRNRHGKQQVTVSTPLPAYGTDGKPLPVVKRERKPKTDAKPTPTPAQTTPVVKRVRTKTTKVAA